MTAAGSARAYQDSAARPRRRYQSPRRQEGARATRARICSAAEAEFLARGYAGATVRAIAAAAAVARPTVELVFGTKARLLKAVIDRATAGDDEPVPMLERSWAATAVASRDADGFVAAFAREFTAACQRAGRLILVALDAARSDAEISAVATQLMHQREIMATWLVDGLEQRAPLRPELDHGTAVDIVWTLMDAAVFERLTHHRGWSPAKFQAWFTDSILRLLRERG
jgi:AcrR family transcriptional regulator